MDNFIEIHSREEKVLVNTLWIQQIFRTENSGCTIYFAFNPQDCVEQDYLIPDETYDEVLKKIERK